MRFTFRTPLFARRVPATRPFAAGNQLAMAICGHDTLPCPHCPVLGRGASRPLRIQPF
ncbi:hypothetical protein [Dinoroseobacter sp. S375]|uniref:hypothetical protein n=1 Tax=Dinoroseobacter sp. S375 TaxID=3415136 RepID=UPI003C7D951A